MFVKWPEYGYIKKILKNHALAGSPRLIFAGPFSYSPFKRDPVKEKGF